MATQTAHYELEKPSQTDVVDVAVLNNNFDDIDVVMFTNQERSKAAVSNAADAYDAAQTYTVGDLVIYENQLYKCTTAITTAEQWDSTKWAATTLADELGEHGGGTEVEANPSGTATDTLSKIGIAGTIYEILGGGGTGGSGMFVDTNNVIVPLTLFTSEMSYTATEDCFVFSYLVTRNANYSPEVRIDDQLAYTNYYGNTIVGNSCFLPLKKGQTLTVAGVNQTVGSQYCVYGVTYINKIIQPVIYSEEEREIGVWTDGKPLYQKTYIITSPSAEDSNIDIGISNVENVVNEWGTWYRNVNGATWVYDLNAVNENSFNVQFIVLARYKITENRLFLSIQSGAYSGNVLSVRYTIQYTKTTDTAGSGIWTPSGVPAVHYSTDEHVVGTWIDGSTIYERTYDLGSDLVVSYNSFTETSIDASSMSRLVGNPECIYSTGATTYPVITSINSNNRIALQTTRNGAAANVRYVTIRYTKSTT